LWVGKTSAGAPIFSVEPSGPASVPDTDGLGEIGEFDLPHATTRLTVATLSAKSSFFGIRVKPRSWCCFLLYDEPFHRTIAAYDNAPRQPEPPDWPAFSNANRVIGR
jgi:hypothetical protein